MGRKDWSSEQLAQELSHGFSLLARMELGGGLPQGEAAALADGVLQCMNSTLLKVSEALEEQTRLRAEILSLKSALKEAEGGRVALERGRDERMRALESEVRQLRDERQRLADALESVGQCEAAPGGVARAVCPPDSLLNEPLVVRTAQGDYLGVSDQAGQRLSLREFLGLVERQSSSGAVVCSSWEHLGTGWLLSLGLTCGPDAAWTYALDMATVRTPSGNRVTVLRRMCFNGASVPDAYLLQMFRQLRDGVQE